RRRAEPGRVRAQPPAGHPRQHLARPARGRHPTSAALAAPRLLGVDVPALEEGEKMSIPTPSTRLAGKTILVTGAAGGIGEAYARHLAAAGAAVAIADLGLDAARQTAERLSAGCARTAAVRIDVREPASIAAAFDACEAALGSVDLLVNNAGVCIREPFLTITEDQFRLMHEVNARGALLCTQEFARRAIDAGRGGKVINTCSTSSRQASADFAAYAASKAATLSVTHSSARA